MWIAILSLTFSTGCTINFNPNGMAQPYAPQGPTGAYPPGAGPAGVPPAGPNSIPGVPLPGGVQAVPVNLTGGSGGGASAGGNLPFSPQFQPAAPGSTGTALPAQAGTTGAPLRSVGPAPSGVPAAPAAAGAPTRSGAEITPEIARDLQARYRYLSGVELQDSLARFRAQASSMAPAARQTAAQDFLRQIQALERADLDGEIRRFRDQLARLPAANPMVAELTVQARQLSSQALRRGLAGARQEIAPMAAGQNPAAPSRTRADTSPNMDDLIGGR